MTIIKELIEILPQIIMYVITGFVFVKTFHFVLLKQNSTDVEHILTSSLVVGYVYCNIAYKIPFSISYEVDTVLIVLSALILGYGLGKVLQSKKMIYILDFLKIRDTGNLYFWDDIMDNDYPMKVIITYDNAIYEGMLHNYESYSNSPHIILASYIVKKSTGEILNDYSADKSRIIILDISNVKNIEILYSKDSKECEDLQSLCEYHDNFE